MKIVSTIALSIIAFAAMVFMHGGIQSSSSSSAGGGGGSTRGTFASRTACSTAGSSYFATDVPIISECNASTWADWAYGQNVTLPSAITFTTILNSAVITTNGVAQINGPAAVNAYGEDLALPTPPYTLFLGFRCSMITSGGYCGIYIRDTAGTKIVTWAMQALGPASTNFQIAHFSNYTGFTGGVQDFSQATVNMLSATGNYLEIHDDGTNFTYFICTDRFNCSPAIFSQSRTANLTAPGFIGWFVTGNTNNPSQVNMVVSDFTITQP